MRFAFDLDGTAWQFNATFTALAHALQAKGHEIGVLTGHMDHLRAADLHLWGSRGFPEPDFFLNASDAERVGIVHARPQREWKPELARRHGVNVLFDDFEGGPIEMSIFEEAT